MKKFFSNISINIPTQKDLLLILRSSMWFFLGVILGLFFSLSFFYIYYHYNYKDKIYPGIAIDHIRLDGWTKEEVKQFFRKKNNIFYHKTITLKSDEKIATTSALKLNIGYDEDLLAEQAFAIGRSENLLSNLSLILQSYINGINLEPAYHFNEKEVSSFINQFQKIIDSDPINARFIFENGRVTEFQTAKDGKKVDVAKLKELLLREVTSSTKEALIISVPIITIKPEVTNEEANNLGIVEKIGEGRSYFAGSIANRIYNITLAATRLNGILIKPGEVFSFNKALGEVSVFTGYKQAYVIQNGRTVLGDGGGVCQVSTTLFRAILNAGLPVIERNQHAYRVSYYEQDSGPGIDAAIYTPTLDLKFKNDTENYILIQAHVNPDQYELTFELYGTKDGREVFIGKPVIVSQSPAPEPLYQDDPTLPKGVIKQIDWAAAGAVVYFTRQVRKNGKILIDEKFTSHYRPWQAVYLRGTKEG
jgi:vancomycin resistance protein YoaR